MSVKGNARLNLDYALVRAPQRIAAPQPPIDCIPCYLHGRKQARFPRYNRQLRLPT